MTMHIAPRRTLAATIFAGLGAAILAAAVASSASAQGHATFALQHFNQDQDSIGDIRSPNAGRNVVISTQGGSNLGVVYDRLNGDFDSVGDLRGVTGQVTIASGQPAHAAEIFARLRAESLEDEN